MSLHEEIKSRSENIRKVNEQLKGLEKIDWRKAMQLLMDGKDIYKLEKREDEYFIARYRYREEEYEYSMGVEKETRFIREFERHKAFIESPLARLSDDYMNIVQFASQEWYRENPDIGVGKFS